MRQVRLLKIIFAAALSIGASPEPLPPAFVDLAPPFEQVAVATNGEPASARIATVLRKLDSLLPGLYPDGVNTDRRIAQALVDLADSRLPSAQKSMTDQPGGSSNVVKLATALTADA